MAPELQRKNLHYLIVCFCVVVAVLAIAVVHRPSLEATSATARVAASASEPRSELGHPAAKPQASASAPISAAEGRRADLLAQSSIQQIAKALRDQIMSTPRYAELSECGSPAPQACRELLSQGIFEAMHSNVLVQAMRGELGLKELTAHDADALYDAAGRVLTDSVDSVERASALLLLRTVSSLPGRALPEVAYHDLSSRTVAEAQLTLQHAIGGPIPYPSAARELVTLFTSGGDSRLQDSALGVLAFPETEPELLASVRATARTHGPDSPEWLTSIGPAVARCGMACVETMDAVLDASGDSPAVAEEMLRAISESERLALTEHMKGRFEPKALFALATSAGVELPAN